MTVYELLRETIRQWSAHNAPLLGAALAYYSAFSIGPLLLVVIALTGLLFGQDAVRSELVGAMTSLLGETGAQGVQAILAEASKPRTGFWAAAIGAMVLVFGALAVVVQLKSSLNVIWNVAPTKARGIAHFVRSYVLSLAAVLGISFLLVVSMAFSAAVKALGHLLVSDFGEVVIQSANFALSFGLVTLLFALMFRYLPDAAVRWRDVWVGAVLTAALFTAGRFALGYYVTSRSMESAFGAVASVPILLIWVYYSAQIVFLGAEFTQVYASRRDSARRGQGARQVA